MIEVLKALWHAWHGNPSLSAPGYRWEPMQKLNGWHRVSEGGEIVATVRELSGGGWGVWFASIGLDNRNFITADVARGLVERHYPDAEAA